RMIRFGLLQGWCVEKRITGLVLAHHGDDQIETFALRLEARSRACGLAAMAAVQPLHAVTLLRPMLDCKRCDIIKSAHALGLRWDEDPSNRNVNVRRVYFRTALREQPGLGECFDNTVKPLRRWRDALEDRLGLWWHKNAAGAWNRWGGASLRLDAFAELAPDVACHCFGQLLMRVSGRMIPPRRAQSLRVLHAMTVDDFRRCSLAGCLLAKRGDRLQIDHEAMQPASCAIRIANHRLLWCNRFHVLAQNAPGQARIGACGEAHGGVIRQMFKKHEAPHGETAILPSRAACAALPGLWLGGTLIALPFCDPAHRVRPAGHPSRLPALHITSCARVASSKPYQ
ncbi:MAG: ATP-binding protein, partial [Pseudomonadota bacterium]